MALLGNVIKVEVERVSRVPYDVTKTINPGDMLLWDNSNHFVYPVVAGHAGSAGAAFWFVGVSNDRSPIASLGGNLPFGQLTVVTRGIIEFTADDNATYNPGDAVMFGAGPQLVRKAASNSNTTSIGIVAPENQNFDASAGAPTGIVAVQGTTKLLIALRPQFTNLSTV